MKSVKSKSMTTNQSVNSERNRPQSPGSLSVKVAGSWASDFVDNRSTAIAQRKLQGMVGQSPQVQRVAQLQATVNGSPRVQARGVLQEMVDNSPRVQEQAQQQAGSVWAYLASRSSDKIVRRRKNCSCRPRPYNDKADTPG